MAIANAFNRQGGTVPSGGGGSFDGTIKEVSFTDQTQLTITHDFSNTPTVLVLDSDGSLVHAQIQHTSSTQILINFAINLSGTVIIR
jgi:hypothetical protein